MPRVASDAAARIGGLIAEHRLKAQMTQDEVAVKSGIDSSNIRAYENGRGMPSIQSLVRIAEAMGIDPGALLEGLGRDDFASRGDDGRRHTAR